MPALQCSLGCQPPVSDVMWQSVDAERVVAAEWRQTLSEGTVGGIEEGAVTLEPCSRWVDEWVTVEEEEIAAAVVDTLTHTAMQVEGKWDSWRGCSISAGRHCCGRPDAPF